MLSKQMSVLAMSERRESIANDFFLKTLKPTTAPRRVQHRKYRRARDAYLGSRPNVLSKLGATGQDRTGSPAPEPRI